MKKNDVAKMRQAGTAALCRKLACKRQWNEHYELCCASEWQLVESHGKVKRE